MSTLRLGVVNLEPKDVAYVRALVRLFAHTEKLRWSFADAAPYDAVVATAAARTAQPAFFDGFMGMVLTLVNSAGSHDADSIAHPIRADQFREWLRMRQDGVPAAPPQVQAAPATPVAEVSVQAPAAPAEATPPPKDIGRHFKLRRWPGPDVLAGDPLTLRMATLMSRKALSTAQLAALTAQSADACHQVLSRLQEAGLLMEQAGGALVPAAALGAAADSAGAQVAAPPATPAKLGLMASLRRHLGL